MKRLHYLVSEVFDENFRSNHYNVLYAIKNLLDGRYYIGQCYDLIDRFRDNKLWAHKIKNSYIANSIRKYGPNNFQVIIIKEGVSPGELDRLEILYIARMHTYHRDPWWLTHQGLKQYNQDPGGHGPEKMESLLKSSMESRTLIGNGDPAYMLHNREVYEKSAQTRQDLYGARNGRCGDPEVVKRSMETNKANHGGHYAWNTPEQVQAMVETQRKNHDGKLAFHTEIANERRIASFMKSIDQKLKTDRDNHGGMLAYHTPEARESARSTMIERYGSLCAPMHTPEVRGRAKETRWLNAFIITCERMLKECTTFSLDNYIRYKHSHAPAPSWVVDFMKERMSSGQLSILSKFDSIDIPELNL